MERKKALHKDFDVKDYTRGMKKTKLGYRRPVTSGRDIDMVVVSETTEEPHSERFEEARREFIAFRKKYSHLRQLDYLWDAGQVVFPPSWSQNIYRRPRRRSI